MNSKTIKQPVLIHSEKTKKAMTECKEYIAQEEQGLLNQLESRYPDLRKYTPKFFTLDFKAAPGSEFLIDAIKILRQINEGTLRSLPDDVPIKFVPRHWKILLKNNTGKINQRIWELLLYFAVKDALNTGDLYLSYSRHHKNFWETIYTQEAWQEKKQSLCRSHAARSI